MRTLVPKPKPPPVAQGNLPSQEFTGKRAFGLSQVTSDREIRSPKIRVSVLHPRRIVPTDARSASWQSRRFIPIDIDCPKFSYGALWRSISTAGVRQTPRLPGRGISPGHRDPISPGIDVRKRLRPSDFGNSSFRLSLISIIPESIELCLHTSSALSCTSARWGPAGA